MEKSEIKKIITVNATPEKVFHAISDEKELQKWWVDVPYLEKKVGGKVLFKFLKENSKKLQNDYIVEGKIIEFLPNKKLVYSWKPANEPDFPDSIVNWSLEPEDSNKTKLVMAHRGLGGCSSFSLLEEGWIFFLGKLEKLFT